MADCVDPEHPAPDDTGARTSEPPNYPIVGGHQPPGSFVPSYV